MIKFEKKVEKGTPDTTVTLVRDLREKSRLKVVLEDGREAGLFFEKGVSFQDGDLIISDDGGVLVEIKAADETVSTVRCEDPLQLARVCYHLGNRHIPLQINEGFLRYQHDHVLDDMVRGLGLEVTTEQAPFEPESGAYSKGGHHQHSHDHSHEH
ncbi:MAG: urease accessory protein UreE [Cocleimonas sp.]|nr:urease accessory protein UreE [Cocleimonas sp.]